jgi:uncharacterized repeat protein (TIGR03803 family)
VYTLAVCLAFTACGGSYATTPNASFNPAMNRLPWKPVKAMAAERVLYSFSGVSDGSSPVAGLISDASGALYGTTAAGGGTGCGGSGCGTVFKFAPSSNGYKETIIYNFTGEPDGQSPLDGLAMDGAGALYGTTYMGGAGGLGCPPGPNCGAVFKLTPSGSGYAESILYSFKLGTDGAYPDDRVIIGRDGALYGTTSEGGEDAAGTVFKIERSGVGYRVLYNFKGGDDGNDPVSALLAGPKGVFYGTTVAGGTSKSCYSGCGVVYKLFTSGITSLAAQATANTRNRIS